MNVKCVWAATGCDYSQHTPCDTICIMAQWGQAEKASLPSERPVRDCTQGNVNNVNCTTEDIWPAPSTVLASCQSSKLNQGCLQSVSLAALSLQMYTMYANQGNACSGAGLAIERTSHPPRTPVTCIYLHNSRRKWVQKWLLRQKSSEDASMLEIRWNKAVNIIKSVP